MDCDTVLYALGSNGSGQLGVGTFDDCSQPTRTTLPVKQQHIRQIIAGGNHTMVLLSNGEIYAAGNNPDGRCLTRPDTMTSTSQREPRFRIAEPLIPSVLNPKFKICAATWEATTALLQNGMLITGGTGRRGELGLGEATTQAPLPTIVPDFPPSGTDIVDISSSMAHTVVILSNGEVYGWGAGRKGQLGEPYANYWTPTKLQGMNFHARRVACGRDFTFIAGDPSDGRFALFGSNKFSIISAAHADIRNWKSIGASWGSIFVLLSSGVMVSWGRNDHGQLAPNDLPTVRDMAIGSEHAVCLTDNGMVVAWGWGEHGNCGPIEFLTGTTSNGSKICLPGDPLLVGAGCSTTWIASRIRVRSET
jgi:protein ATS1